MKRLALAAALSLPLAAQPSNVLSVAPPAKLILKRGETAVSRVAVQLANGYHVNSNTPSDAYLIPLRLTWESNLLQPLDVSFPQPKMEKYEFSEKPLSVFTGDFELTTRWKAPEKAPAGPNIILGKLRYQACNHKMCLPPKTLEVRLPVEVR